MCWAWKSGELFVYIKSAGRGNEAPQSRKGLIFNSHGEHKKVVIHEVFVIRGGWKVVKRVSPARSTKMKISPSLSNSWNTVWTTYGSNVCPVEIRTALWNSLWSEGVTISKIRSTWNSYSIANKLSPNSNGSDAPSLSSLHTFDCRSLPWYKFLSLPSPPLL